MHYYYFPFFLIALGVFAIRVLGGGEDWYDVWNEGEPYGWLTDFKEFFRALGFVLVVATGLCFFWAITPSTTNSFTSSYSESTPIKVASARVASSAPAKQHKKRAHKKGAVKRHPAAPKRMPH